MSDKKTTRPDLLSMLESRWALVQQVTALLAGFGLSGWAAAASAWLNQYGPVAWVAAGFAGAFGVAVLLAIGSWSLERLAARRLTQSYAATPKAVNVLEDTFVRQRIPIAAFYRPGPLFYDKKTFRDCEFIGPGLIGLLNRNNVNNPMMHDSGAAFIVANGSPVTTVVAFSDSTFIDCKFFNVGFVFPALAPEEYKDAMRKILNPDGKQVFPNELIDTWAPS